MPRTAALLVAGAFVLAACADDDQEIRATPQTAPTSAEASPTASPAALPSAIPVSASPTPLGKRALARIDISIGPDWLAAGAGSIWVRTDSGDVVRIDPATNKVAARIPVAGPAVENVCQGIGADDTAVWSCAPDGDVVRIDPATNKVAATVSVGKFSDQGHIPLVFGHVWLLTGDGSTLVGLVHDAVDVTVDLGTRCNDLAATATSLWASCLTGDQVVQVDPTASQVVSRVTGLDTARLIAAAGGSVWATFLGGLAQIDEATGAIRTLTQVYVGPQAGLFADPSGLWVRDQGLFLTRVDTSGHVVEQLSVPEQSGGSVLTAFGSLWATAYDDEVLYRVAL